MLSAKVPFWADDEGGRALVRQIQSGRYPKIRSRVSGVSSGFARLVGACLAARPRKRPQSATDLRERLERVVGPVAPGECRAEIAAWLWGAGVFRLEEDATVALPQHVPRRKRRRRPLPAGWLAAVAAAFGLVAGAASLNTLAFHQAGVSETVGRLVDTLTPSRAASSNRP